MRLNLFKKKYPAFVPQVVKAVMEHQNLANSDRITMDAYCKLFELDWRGDRALENREQFMMSHPVYMHGKDQSNLLAQEELNNETVLKRVRQACKPYLPDLLTKMRNSLKQ